VDAEKGFFVSIQEKKDNEQFALKAREFQVAMERYHQYDVYRKTGLLVSVLVVSLQILTVIHFYMTCFELKLLNSILAVLFAYMLADFVNGLIHMYMDNNTNYNSFFGPFIAAFHLHHLKPRYSDSHFLVVYFNESGTKFWLVFYLGILIGFQYLPAFPTTINLCLVSFGIFSSLAEVSHYWCHNSKNRLILILQRYRIFLPKKHHLVHHKMDNKNYAFLNGFSDPFINLIAGYLYQGYKNNSDAHAKAYQGAQTHNRS